MNSFAGTNQDMGVNDCGVDISVLRQLPDAPDTVSPTVKCFALRLLAISARQRLSSLILALTSSSWVSAYSRASVSMRFSLGVLDQIYFLSIHSLASRRAAASASALVANPRSAADRLYVTEVLGCLRNIARNCGGLLLDRRLIVSGVSKEGLIVPRGRGPAKRFFNTG